MRLTKRSVEGLPLKDEIYIIWDGDVKGFGVRIYPSGKRSYRRTDLDKWIADHTVSNTSQHI